VTFEEQNPTLKFSRSEDKDTEIPKDNLALINEDEFEDSEVVVDRDVQQEMQPDDLINATLDNVRRSTRITQVPLRYQANAVSELFERVNLVVTDEKIPRNHKEAMLSSECDNWSLACINELMAMKDMEVYELIPRRVGKKPIATKWVFAFKRDEFGVIVMFKARLVVRGFAQIEGFDYIETFSPVIKGNSVRILLSLSNTLGWTVYQMDVKTAFLNSTLSEEIHVEQPEGFKCKENPDFVWRLKKALYGLKQSSREWWITLHSYLSDLGFVPYQSDPCLFVLMDGEIVVAIVGIYVDDILIAGPVDSSLKKIKEDISERFHMKDMGEVKRFLGLDIEFRREEKMLFISQRQYVLDVMLEFNFSALHPVSIPMESTLKLSNSQCPVKDSDHQSQMKTKPYRELIGALLYLACSSRPDISYAVSTLSRFVCNPGLDHWNALVHLCQYLIGTVDYGLVFDGNVIGSEQVYGYSDADWGGDLDGRRSRSGYAIFMNGGCVTWRSKLQKCVSQSSLEAEYVAGNEAGRELKWTRTLAEELGFKQRTTVLFEDNLGCIATSVNPIINERSKHIDVKYHWLRKEVKDGHLSLVYCPTADMVADIFTKALGKNLFDKH